MRKYFIAVLIALLTAPAWAIAANDVSVSQSVNILYPGDGLTYILYAGSTFDSFTVNADNLVFVVSANSDIKLISADAKNFTVTYASDEGLTNVVDAVSCSGTNSVLHIQGRSTATSSYTLTVVPSGTFSCSGASSGGSSGGGGGGGGSASTPAEAVTGTGESAASSLDSMSSDGGAISLATPASQSISGTSGGSVSLSDSSASISVPANALSSNVTLSLTPQAAFAQPKAGYGAVGSQSYNISAVTSTGVKVSQFDGQLSLIFAYTNEQVADFDESTLVVSYWSEETGQWVDLPTTVDSATNRVTASAAHLTKFILQAKAKTTPGGSLIKAAGKTTVYYLGHDNKRYVFPDDKVFYSWYQNFNDVITVTAEQLAGYTLGGNVIMRSGTRLVQFVGYSWGGAMVVDDPKIYAVEPDGRLRWITTAEIAASLYGSSWEKRIAPVHNVLAGNYVISAPIESASYPTGSLVNDLSSNALYYISGTQKRMVTAAGRTANRFASANYLEAADLSGYETIGALNDYQNSIGWTAGK